MVPLIKIKEIKHFQQMSQNQWINIILEKPRKVPQLSWNKDENININGKPGKAKL